MSATSQSLSVTPAAIAGDSLCALCVRTKLYQTKYSASPRDQFRIVELAGCNLSPALGRLSWPKFYETLLPSCMAAFAIGLVLACASVFG
jgi:hypothetical protein